jgi:GNAT superfamily N-acetyltransferase
VATTQGRSAEAAVDSGQESIQVAIAASAAGVYRSGWRSTTVEPGTRAAEAVRSRQAAGSASTSSGSITENVPWGPQWRCTAATTVSLPTPGLTFHDRPGTLPAPLLQLGARLGEVLAAEHAGGTARLDRGADAVGSDVLFGVAEARGEQDLVELADQGAVPHPPVQYAAVGVGEQHAHRGVGEHLLQAVQDRARGVHEAAIGVEVAGIGCLKRRGGRPRSGDPTLRT